MAYEKTNWTSTTPINPTNLNKIENGIEQNSNDIETNNTNIGNLTTLNTTEKTNLVGAINEVYKNNTYSTTEQVIGKWIDGKPLYRNTFSFNDTLSSSSPIKKAHNISNVSTIFIDTAHSFIEETTTGKSIPLPTTCSDGNFSDTVGVQVDKSNINIYAQTTWNTTWEKVITLLYTKTTD